MTQEHYAFREIDRAVAMTKFILIPFNVGIWLRLGILIAIGGPQNLSLAAMAPLFTTYLALVTFCGLIASVPFVTFLRTYSLYVIGNFDQRYALLPELPSPDGKIASGAA